MTLAVVLSYASMFLITWISTRRSKRIAMVVGLSIVLVGTVVNYFAIDPRWPWMMFVAGGITFLGLQGCWLMIDSMVADVCDDDELATGRRREGMFSAVKGFALKAAQAITFGIGGYMATAVGYDPAVVDAAGLDEATAMRMKLALVGFQSLGLVLSIGLVWLYPISRARAAETQRLLEERASGSRTTIRRIRSRHNCRDPRSDDRGWRISSCHT